MLCAVSGMLPDLDSDSGIPARETISFAAAIGPMLLFNRLHASGFAVEQFILFGVPLYLLIRFGIGGLLRAVTIHRGMFHSIPAMLIAGMLTYLACDVGHVSAKLFKAGGVMLGFFSHLFLDEVYSVEVRGLTTRVKSSFGTALKFFGNNPAANMACYSLLLLLGLAVLEDYQSQVGPGLNVAGGEPRSARPGVRSQDASPPLPARGSGVRPETSSQDWPAEPRDLFTPPPAPRSSRRPPAQARQQRFDRPDDSFRGTLQ
jgi:membrane-bound metal-dependent hydrolase YbcI (DUF457 family)